MFDIVEAISTYSDQVPHDVRKEVYGTLDYVQNLSARNDKQYKSEFYQILIEVANWAMIKFQVESDEECRYFQRHILQMTAELIEKEK